MDYDKMLKSGTVVSCDINGKHIPRAIIHRDDKWIWFCQNSVFGGESPNKYGMKYSWVCTASGIGNGCVTNIVLISDSASTDSQRVHITYTANGVVYTQNSIGGRSLEEANEHLKSLEMEIKTLKDTIKIHQAELVAEKNRIATHAKLAKKGWTLKGTL